MGKANSITLEKELIRLHKLLETVRLEYHQSTMYQDAAPRYSKLLLAGQVMLLVVLLISVLPNVSFLLDWNQPMKKGAFAVTAVCMAGMLVLPTVHIVLNVRCWIDGIKRNNAWNRLRTETENKMQSIRKELEKCREENRKVYPNYEFVGDEWSNDFYHEKNFP